MLNYLVTVINGIDLIQLAQDNYILKERREGVKINDRRGTEDLDVVLRTYPNTKQYISCLPLLLHSNHIIPQVKVTVRFCDGKDIKVLDEALRKHPVMCY